MLEIPYTKDYGKNLRKAFGDGMPCAICGRMVFERNYKHWIHVGQGGSHFVTDAEASGDSGDMGYFPVGPDCWKKHPEIHQYGFTEEQHA